MDKKILTISMILTLVLTVFLLGCEEQKIPSKPNTPSIIIPDNNEATDEGIKSVVNSNNEFAFDLYSQYAQTGDNIFFSPYSISTALAMTYEGAKGKTAEEIYKVLRFPPCMCKMAPCNCDNPESRRPAFANIINNINKKDKKYLLSTANALWVQKDYALLKEYLDTTETYYNGKATNLNFISQPEESRVTINTWVEQQTNNKIKDLIPKGMIDSMTRLVLTNAIYFKGKWITQFDEKNTFERDFRATPNYAVKAQMMSIAGEKFNYAENEKVQMLELPYSGEELSMLVILPKDETSTALESLNLAEINGLKQMLSQEKVNIYMPKFKFETKYFMSDTLANMGMPTAFSGEADFSGMTGKRDLAISEVIHQAFVEVNEEGTEAAAATVVIMKTTSVGPDQIKIFNADHPFIFIIQQKSTGNILFFGRVSNPAKN